MGKPHVVILGAGFGGLEAAKTLAGEDVDVTVVDKRNHHLFQPLLYQVATAGLAATDIAAPIRRVLAKQENCTVLLGRATAIDPQARTVALDGGDGTTTLSYDALILACGMTNAYFGHDEWEAAAPGLKSLEEALDVRRRVLLAFEAAERLESDDEGRRALLTFVVIGGGPTGVELAGALAEIARQTLAQNFRHFDPSEAKVLLVEGGPRVLASFPNELSQYAKEELESLGVEVRTRALAKTIDAHGVTIQEDGGELERIDAHTVLWAAGVGGVPIVKTLGVPLQRGGRVAVDETLAVRGLERVFAIGDIAYLEQDGEALPGVAQVAIQGGARAAKNVVRLLAGRKLVPFRYKNLGEMATIGRSRAVAVIGKMRLTGMLAWLAWLFVHLMALVGFRNRVVVLLEWAWAYVSFQRSARIILDAPVARPRAPTPAE
jgi:NADH dehydrogenase